MEKRNLEEKKLNIDEIIFKFIEEMNYMDNEHVLGCFFYGSYLTGFNCNYSDIDLHIVFDDSEPDRLVRGNKYLNGIRIEYFEKPIGDLYLSVETEYNNQNNALMSILGTSRIIFDKKGDLSKLQQFVCSKFSNPLPKLGEEEAKEYVSILANRMEKLENACINDTPYFHHLYHLTIEKIRVFYHKLNGMPEVQTSKVYRVYTEEDYRNSFFKSNIPEEEFIEMYLDAISDESLDKVKKLEKVQALFHYATRNITLGEDYRILIKSRNLTPKRYGKIN